MSNKDYKSLFNNYKEEKSESSKKDFSNLFDGIAESTNMNEVSQRNSLKTNLKEMFSQLNVSKSTKVYFTQPLEERLKELNKFDPEISPNTLILWVDDFEVKFNDLGEKFNEFSTSQLELSRTVNNEKNNFAYVFSRIKEVVNWLNKPQEEKKIMSRWFSKNSEPEIQFTKQLMDDVIYEINKILKEYEKSKGNNNNLFIENKITQAEKDLEHLNFFTQCATSAYTFLIEKGYNDFEIFHQRLLLTMHGLLGYRQEIDTIKSTVKWELNKFYELKNIMPMLNLKLQRLMNNKNDKEALEIINKLKTI